MLKLLHYINLLGKFVYSNFEIFSETVPSLILNWWDTKCLGEKYKKKAGKFKHQIYIWKFRDLYIYSNIEIFTDCFLNWIDGRCQSANQNLPTVPINVLAPRPQSSNLYQCFGWTDEYGWKMEARLRLWTCGGRFHVSFVICFWILPPKKLRDF